MHRGRANCPSVTARRQALLPVRCCSAGEDGGCEVGSRQADALAGERASCARCYLPSQDLALHARKARRRIGKNAWDATPAVRREPRTRPMTTSTTVAEPPSSAFLSPKVWLAPYALMVSTLYLWGYWGTFGINVLDYIGVSDIIKAAVYPVVSAFAFMAIGALLGEVLSPRLEPGAGANTPVAKLLRKAAPYIVAAYAALVVGVALFGGPNKWHLVPILLAVAAYLPAKAFGLLAREIRSDGIRSIAVFLLVALVPFSFGHGRKQANEVIDSATYQVVVSELPLKASGAKLSTAEKPRFVGKLGDRLAVYDPVARSVSLIAASELKVLTLSSSASGTEHLANTPSSAGSAPPVAASSSIPAPSRGGASAAAQAVARPVAASSQR